MASSRSGHGSKPDERYSLTRRSGYSRIRIPSTFSLQARQESCVAVGLSVLLSDPWNVRVPVPAPSWTLRINVRNLSQQILRLHLQRDGHPLQAR